MAWTCLDADAQPRIADSYQQAAAAYDAAAAKTRCPENARCYREMAAYHRALAGQLSAAGGSRPSEPSCQIINCPQTADGQPLAGFSSSSAATAGDSPPPGVLPQTWANLSGSQRAVIGAFSAASSAIAQWRDDLEARHRREAAERRERERANKELTERAANELKAVRAHPHYKAFARDESKECRVYGLNPDYFLEGIGNEMVAGLSDDNAKQMYTEIAAFHAWLQQREQWRSWLDIEGRILTGEMFVAVSQGSVSAIRLLLWSGARVDVPDSTGRTAFDHAMEGDNLDVKIEVLVGLTVPSRDRHFTNAEIK